MNGSEANQQGRDEEQLRKLGYAQALLRDMGGFANFAVSFSIISILTGAVTLYGHGLRFGGPFVMLVGWPLVAVMTLLVAASLAQLASAFPTAGALYHWSAMLGGPGWGFLTAWLNTLGQFAITAGIDYGLAEFVVAMLGGPSDRSYVLPVYAGILITHGLLNHVGVTAVSLLNRLSAWYHIVGVALLLGALMLWAPRQDLGFLTTRFTSEAYPYSYAFLIALLQAQWTFTGYDASAHVTEETRDPGRNAPWGIFLSVLVSAIVGYVMLLGVTLAIQDLPATAAASNPFIHILRTALGEGLGNALVWIVMGAMWFCGLASITSNSRMLYAFARDRGLPLSGYLSRVSPRFRSPHVAVWASTLCALLVALWAQAYSAMVALSTLALYASYGVPIAIGLWARRRGVWATRGPWDLGRWSLPINVLALGWVAVVTVLFVLPPNQLAGYTFAGALVALGLYWALYMRRSFTGPPVTLAGFRKVETASLAR
ncbi:MAG: amino acid permease [Myxococcota bacterium]|nr:amino acid permease [Myxococcota bacterium]